MEIVDAVPEGVDIYRTNNWHKASRWFYELSQTPAILDYVEDVIGPEFNQWGGGFFIKFPHDETEVPFHQDASYWPPRSTHLGDGVDSRLRCRPGKRLHAHRARQQSLGQYLARGSSGQPRLGENDAPGSGQEQIRVVETGGSRQLHRGADRRHGSEGRRDLAARRRPHPRLRRATPRIACAAESPSATVPPR